MPSSSRTLDRLGFLDEGVDELVAGVDDLDVEAFEGFWCDELEVLVVEEVVLDEDLVD